MATFSSARTHPLAHITVKRGRDFQQGRLFKPQLCVRVSVGSESKQRDPDQFNGTCPVWNESFIFALKRSDQPVVVEVMDTSAGSYFRGGSLGQAVLQPSLYEQDRKYQLSLPVMEKGSIVGHVLVDFRIESLAKQATSAQSATVVPPPILPPPVRYGVPAPQHLHPAPHHPSMHSLPPEPELGSDRGGGHVQSASTVSEPVLPRMYPMVPPPDSMVSARRPAHGGPPPTHGYHATMPAAQLPSSAHMPPGYMPGGRRDGPGGGPGSGGMGVPAQLQGYPSSMHAHTRTMPAQLHSGSAGEPRFPAPPTHHPDRGRSPSPPPRAVLN